MFTIQYATPNGEHRIASFDGSRTKLVSYLARFDYPIMAIYEQATVVTKAVRNELKIWPGSLSREAREFAFS